MPSHPQTLASLLAILAPLGVFLGVGLILPGSAGFLYGGRPLRLSPAGPLVELTSIGGGVEPCDASLDAAARREAMEEIQCNVRLLPSADTLVVRRPGQVETVSLEGNEQPAAVVCRRHRTPPHSPWHPQNQGETCIVVFLAELLNCPRPSPEIPFLARLDPETLTALARTDRPFGSLAAGWKMLAPSACPPADTVVRLTDSQEALILALGDRALPFYRSIAARFG